MGVIASEDVRLSEVLLSIWTDDSDGSGRVQVGHANIVGLPVCWDKDEGV